MRIIGICILLLFINSCSNVKVNPCLNDAIVFESIKETKDRTICFNSVDSYDLDYKNKKNIVIHGHLTFPKAKQDLYTAVILSHGSGGIRKFHREYVDMLNEHGYVVFQIDHYTNRGIKYDKTFSKASGVTFMNDAYKALNLVRTHPKINKIGYIGWSKGGVGPILSHFKYVTDFINHGKINFDASIAIYPYCGFTFPKDSITTIPLLILTGSDDKLTPEKACKNLHEKFNKDNKITHISLEGATHGWDNFFLYFGFFLKKLPSLDIINNDCTVTISNNGAIMTLNKKIISDPTLHEELLHDCSSRGVELKYNSEAAHKTKILILDYLEKYL